jgi:misacylated tRNA(Ala) deacylase
MQATELLYLYDSYLTTATARVIAADGQNVVLDRTVFYPRGGGQMADRGCLHSYGHIFGHRRREARRCGVPHLDGVIPSVGSQVECHIDWEYRYQMMRTHTALHVLCGVIYHQYGAQVTGCQMYPDRARMDFTLADLSRSAWTTSTD